MELESDAAPPLAEIRSWIGDHVPGLEAVALFGSHARGTDVKPASDVDLLLVVEAGRVPREVRHQLRCEFGPRVSVATHTWKSLEELKTRDWSFVRHLELEAQHWVDPQFRLAEAFNVPTPSWGSVHEEILEHRTALTELKPFSAYGGHHLAVYARLFEIVKSATILANGCRGTWIFERNAALAALAKSEPECAAELELISSLEPFFLRMQGKHVDLPWVPSLNDGDDPEPYHRAACRLLDAVADR